jgi:cytochrome c biogenesis protein CcmG/thiol:disulfide interchange protein DsbE
MLSVAATRLLSADAASAQTLDLGSYKGKVVLLDFWASWCTPCRLSFPWMNAIQRSLGSEGLVVVAVDVDHDREPASRFLATFPTVFKIVFDPAGALAGKYDIREMPTSFLIGRDGKVRYVHSGFYPNKEDAHLADIRTLLDERKP